MKRNKLIATVLAGLVSVAALTTVLNAAENPGKKQPKEIEDVMKWAHKGKDSIAAHVRDGKGTKEEINTLLRFYEFLATQKAPRGDAADWKARTTALVEAAKKLKRGDADAVAAYKKAVDCKACHDLHKPKDE